MKLLKIHPWTEFICDIHNVLEYSIDWIVNSKTFVCVTVRVYCMHHGRCLCCGWFTSLVKKREFASSPFSIWCFCGNISHNSIRAMLVCLFYAIFSSLCGFIYFSFHSIFEYVEHNPNMNIFRCNCSHFASAVAPFCLLSVVVLSVYLFLLTVVCFASIFYNIFAVTFSCFFFRIVLQCTLILYNI